MKLAATFFFLLLLPALTAAHTIDGNDASFVQNIDGAAATVFMYLGAKHMVTGYDHLLFLFGVIFFLYRPVHVIQYVTLFAVGHSITLLLGVLANLQVNAYLIDAIIGLSVVYKALENMGALDGLGRFRPNTRLAVFIFGLFHGLGLATKLQEFELSAQGLVTNIISFNIGVEIGQILALSLIFIALTYWRASSSYLRHAFITNTALMSGGLLLTAYQLSAWLLLPVY
ncbi:MAG: HupE/UreJ family protein [Pseudomonadales bacterium]|nr:HupE/UreJ family protein [Pseudomonadales bacterium]